MDPRVYEWPDFVVLTGLTASFDRARQLSAYFRNARPDVAIAIGGPIARALPRLCGAIFDHVCQGDVDSLDALIDDVLGAGHRADDPAPRYDLAGWSYGLGYAETTTNCNFACSFCSLTGENRAYQPQSSASISRQLMAMGKTPYLVMLDNNFYGNSRADFERRVDLIGAKWRHGDFRGWAALVTGDFFKNPDNLAYVAANGCKALFSGVESFDPAVLKSFNKRQSLSSDPLTLAQHCADHGIAFDYGMMLDFTQQTVAEVGGQIDALLASPRTPLPALLSMTIPILGTPYFADAARAGRLMPNLRLSDLDGQKIVEWPKEPLERVVPFVADLLRFRGRKMALLSQVARHAWFRRSTFDTAQLMLGVFGPLARYGGTVRVGSFRQMRQTWREPRRTYCALTDPLGLSYTPTHRLDAKFARDFEPLYVTDDAGRLTPEVQ